MTNRTKIYFIILQRKIVSLKDLENITNWNKMTIIRAVAPLLIKRKIVSLKDLQDITRWKPITILRAVAPLIIKRKIKAVTHEHTRYFTIIDKPLKNG